MTNELKTKRLVRTAVIAALYALLTVALAPISYGNFQFR
ncbi:MAG: QueT transporter family protein, partial [Clostridium sp.]|nr:QueT transporter family protein [Clostridium sp.]